ncbi:hypothetical protein [Streptomyces sp. SID11385]|uniref:hypothetical protein n=1 Tax=Streptomyces sp. SID11385 TaxID=2706031 RepID=UPI0013CA14C5|nr:hypothetical protein [Streptomyces sp. SID11385]NEA43825.1 hypothetical protein [Streptomyces sp. SID11385]
MRVEAALVRDPAGVPQEEGAGGGAVRDVERAYAVEVFTAEAEGHAARREHGDPGVCGEQRGESAPEGRCGLQVLGEHEGRAGSVGRSGGERVGEECESGLGPVRLREFDDADLRTALFEVLAHVTRQPALADSADPDEVQQPYLGIVEKLCHLADVVTTAADSAHVARSVHRPPVTRGPQRRRRHPHPSRSGDLLHDPAPPSHGPRPHEAHAVINSPTESG